MSDRIPGSSPWNPIKYRGWEIFVDVHPTAFYANGEEVHGFRAMKGVEDFWCETEQGCRMEIDMREVDSKHSR